MEAVATKYKDKVAFVFVYWSTLDTIGHFLGPDSEEHHAELRAIDRGLVAPLREGFYGRVAFLLTADHGHATLDLARAVRFEDHPELLAMLRHPPAGEHRVALMHVKEGAVDEVRAYCAEHFTDGVLADAEDAFALGLYGTPVHRKVVSTTTPLVAHGVPPVKKTIDPSLKPGVKVVDDPGVPALSTSVTRDVFTPAGKLLYHDTWYSSYRAEPKLVRLGPPKEKPKKKQPPATTTTQQTTTTQPTQ